MNGKEIAIWKEHIGRCIDIAAENIEDGLRPPYVGALALDDKGSKLYEDWKGFRVDEEEGGERRTVHGERAVLETTSGLDMKVHTIVTTLEPCMPQVNGQEVESCSDLILKSGVKRVVYGMQDRFFKNRKRETPTSYLQRNGIEVIHIWGLEKEIIERLIRPRGRYQRPPRHKHESKRTKWKKLKGKSERKPTRNDRRPWK